MHYIGRQTEQDQGNMDPYVTQSRECIGRQTEKDQGKIDPYVTQSRDWVLTG